MDIYTLEHKANQIIDFLMLSGLELIRQVLGWMHGAMDDCNPKFEHF